MSVATLGPTPIQLSHIREPSLVEQTILERIENNQQTKLDQHANLRHEGDRAFFVVDLGKVYKQHQRWTKELRQVQPYYGSSVLTSYKVLKLRTCSC